MPENFTIVYENNYDTIIKNILNYVKDNKEILVIEKENNIYLIVFCVSEDIVEFQAERYELESVLSPSLGYIKITPMGIKSTSICKEDSMLQLKEFLEWLLIEYPNYRIYDDEEDEDITSNVKEDIDFLFEDDED